MPSSEEGLLEAPASMSQMELIKEVWDLDDDQLCEALGGPPNQNCLKRRGHSTGGLPWGNLRVPGVVVKPTWIMRNGSQMGRGWRYGKPMQQTTSPPQANADVSCFLSRLMAGLRMGTPRT